MFSADIRDSRVGVGGAPPVETSQPWGSGPSFAWSALAIIVSTVGAALKWVMPSSRSSRQIVAGSTRGRQTWGEPAAVTAHGKHQPSQWNIGSVQRYELVGVRPVCIAIAIACR